MAKYGLWIAILIILVPSINQVWLIFHTRRLENSLRFEEALKNILISRPYLRLDSENYVVCRCPNCGRKFTCLGDLICIFCNKHYGLSPSEAHLVGLSAKKLKHTPIPKGEVAKKCGYG